MNHQLLTSDAAEITGYIYIVSIIKVSTNGCTQTKILGSFTRYKKVKHFLNDYISDKKLSGPKNVKYDTAYFDDNGNKLIFNVQWLPLNLNHPIDD